MARHRLDLLPLLDVFMVVLFVFATIQEQRLDDTTRGRDRLQQRVAEVELVLREAQTREQQQQRRREAEGLDEDQERDEALAELRSETELLRRELTKARRTVTEHKDEVRAELAQAGVSERMLQRVDVLSRVLDKYSVFEIELTGAVDADGGVLSRCCYRVDPLADVWESCGVVPPRPESRERWLDEGAGGLAVALRRTKGGNAMTLVRQDLDAGHRIASRLVEQLRQRYSDQHFYAEERAELEAHCLGEGSP